MGALARAHGRARMSAAPQPVLVAGARWYAAQTLARREAYALGNLRDQGYRCFLPLFEKTVRHARRATLARRALFPGYLFVSLDLTRERWRSVNGTRGVLRLVMAQETPLPTPDGVVENLVKLVDARGLIRLDHGLKPGDRVEITRGPFAQRLGEILSLDDQGRARVLIDMMNTTVAVRLPREALGAV